MITLTVVAFNDTPADGTLQVHFDELGGSIGRADSNQLVLPDPERMISRVAAQVVYRNGAFAIVERGSNPISLNGHALASGREAPLAPGDRVRICGYELSVEAGGAGPAAPNDPFSGMFGPAASAPSAGRPLVDPLARQVGAAAHGERSTPAAAPAGQAGAIPVDWDPFADKAPGGARPGAPSPQRRDALGLEIGGAAPEALIPELSPPPAGPSSLDQLFGLSPSSGGDPLADSALDAPMAQPNMAADADPLRSLKSAPKASGASESDQLSDLNRPFIPPTVIKPAQAAKGAARAVAVSAPVAVPAPVASVVPRAEAPASVRTPAPQPAASPPPMPRSPTSADDGAGAALLEAFRRGLDAPSLELPALTPAVMEVVGQVLREAVRGTMELVGSRAAGKQGLRAEAGSLLARNQNPLKFAPDAEAALRHLLAPPARGSLAGGPAMRDAYDDLRSQQFGLVAGLQAALDTALQRVDPTTLESQLGDRSLLRSLLPASRNARLWEAFGGRYADIRNDAVEQFRQLFSRAFLAAYDEHVKRSQGEPDARSRKRPKQ